MDECLWHKEYHHSYIIWNKLDYKIKTDQQADTVFP